MPISRLLARSSFLLLLTACYDRGLPTATGPDPDEPIDPRPDNPGESGDTLWIYLTGPDGGDGTPLVQGNLPAWSPDGQEIAFERGDSIHIIDIDGREERYLARGRWPAWSPGGGSIAFASSQGIAVMPKNGGGEVVLVRHDFRPDTYKEWDLGVGKPAWSPDGSRIAFEHLGDGDMVPAQIFVMNADGSNPERLTSTRGTQYAESDPSWSPDGDEVAFWSYNEGLAATRPGSGLFRSLYLNFPAVSYGARPAWSPDGSAILFNANLFSAGDRSTWTIATAGGTPHELIRGSINAAWSPDGARLALVRLGPATVLHWRSMAQLPEPRSGAGVVALDSIVYVVGGASAEGSEWTYEDEIFAYDTRTNMWRVAGLLPSGVYAPAVAAIDNLIYIVDGEFPVLSDFGTSDLFIFDPATGRVTRGPGLLKSRTVAAAVALDGKLHLLGGFDGMDGLGGNPTTSHDVFNPATGTWGPGTPMPSPRGGNKGLVLDGKIYVFGGEPYVYSQNVAVYDPTADVWTQDELSNSRNDLAVATLKGRIYLIGGADHGVPCCNGGQEPTAAVDRLDPVSGESIRIDNLPTPRLGLVAAVVGESIYVIGGVGPGPQFRITAVNERFTP